MFNDKKEDYLSELLVVSLFIIAVLGGYFVSLEQVEEEPTIEIEEKNVSDADSQGENLEIGDLAPKFTLPNFHSNEDISLSDYAGEKIILNFFASWCPYCQKEAPDLEKIHLEYGGEVQVITVNLTSNEERPEDIDAYLKHYKVTSPVALDFAGEVAALYQIHSTPTNYFINSDGTISDIVPGAIDYNDIEKKIKAMK